MFTPPLRQEVNIYTVRLTVSWMLSNIFSAAKHSFYLFGSFFIREALSHYLWLFFPPCERPLMEILRTWLCRAFLKEIFSTPSWN
jgi:hypothetical protein